MSQYETHNENKNEEDMMLKEMTMQKNSRINYQTPINQIKSDSHLAEIGTDKANKLESSDIKNYNEMIFKKILNISIAYKVINPMQTKY